MLRTSLAGMLLAFLIVPASAKERNLGAVFMQFDSPDDPEVVEVVMVMSVACNSPSSAAQLQEGDIVLGVNGQSLPRKTFEEYDRIVEAAEMSGVFELTIWRAGGNIFQVTLRPEEHDGDYSCGKPRLAS